MPVVVLAEKPSVARDLARVLGATRRREGYFESDRHVVTWAIGHLVRLPEPHEIDPGWKKWRGDALPMLPRAFPLVVADETHDQYDVVARWLVDPSTTEIVVATDAGREGELIFRYVYERSGSTKPFRRLWISSLTEEAIREGFAKLRPAAELEGLASAARARSRADWLVGMNLSRAYTLAHDTLFSVGRVQTPTLAMLVERDRAIEAFVPEPYLEVHARFDTPRGTLLAKLAGPPDPPDMRSSGMGAGVTSRSEVGDPRGLAGDEADPRGAGSGDAATRLAVRRLPADGVEAEAAIVRARAGAVRIRDVRRRTKKTPPERLYDLTELQRAANRRFGFTAKKTLELAQELYERHKVLSYPRTDSRHLTRDVERALSGVIDAFRARYGALFAEGTGSRPLGSRFVDDAKVGDHHAIIPTDKAPAGLDERSDAFKIYDLVARRLLAAWHPDHVEAVTTVEVEVRAPDADPDVYLARGRSVEVPGWKAVEPGPRAKRDDDAPVLPGGLEKGDPATLDTIDAVRKETRPPPYLTDATLLTAMETAGRKVHEEAVFEAMRESGLGTPATRAQIVETLVSRGYVARDAKTLRSTETGRALIDAVAPDVRSAALTGEWELRLRKMEKNEDQLDVFLEDIEAFVRRIVGDAGPAREPRARVSDPSAAPADPFAPRHSVGVGAIRPLLRDVFGHQEFRPHQEEVARAVIEGKDVLLVMPTGAGKSLCFQLPGLARGGTTLVVSPLIALIEDQVQKLAALGLAAERIHSGRDRATSREVCRRYLAGELDYLFIAPERLRVPGFAELLAKRKPTLVAIDEAHCISMWGHDFRPDYRMLRDRVAPLRPAPIIALTATATRRVQRDICDQLGMSAPLLSVHGFRRANLGVEIAQMTVGDRPEAVVRLLDGPGRRPAIVYAPSRQKVEDLAGMLRRADAYHAGLPAASRDRVQRAFLGGELEVIVATIAFGMGVDKPDVRTVIHTAMPGSVESYYQEIGRAGRDGLPSRAILLTSFADHRTHQFFLDRDYPTVETLRVAYRRLPQEPRFLGGVVDLLDDDREQAEKMLDKLWIHGGALIDREQQVTRGAPTWERGYGEQREARVTQLEDMQRFVDRVRCRMVGLVRHFGDDDSERCGHCDVCAPGTMLAASLEIRRERSRKRGAKKGKKPRARPRSIEAGDAAPGVVEALREWRLAEARALGIPAFRILTDRQLVAIAESPPRVPDDLRTLSGFGSKRIERYGTAIVRIARGSD